ncbi:glycerol kinase, partial [Metabacillus sp. 113a]
GVERPSVNETTALGAAYLAGLTVGYWKNKEEIASQWQVESTFEVEMDNQRQEELYSGWKKAVNATMAFK